MFVHFVLFWLEDPSNPEVIENFEKGLKELVTIDLVKGSHIGKSVPSERAVVDSSYTYSLLLQFDNKKDQDIYQDLPEHHDFINKCSQYWTKV
ncbi:MAG: Dabb family protein, partial [Cyclobacteriaceae bacterium]|nr:Dabb family protein [Cyclobacteriaceae bacterium]